jgi:hypothetical protein
MLMCLVLGAMLAGCAAAPQKSASGVTTDVQKVASVNTWAETKGARVLWVHYPTHEVAQKDE